MNNNLPEMTVTDIHIADGHYHLLMSVAGTLDSDGEHYIIQQIWMPTRKALSKRKAVVMTTARPDGSEGEKIRFDFWVDAEHFDHAGELFEESVRGFLKRLREHTSVRPTLDEANTLIEISQSIIEQLAN